MRPDVFLWDAGDACTKSDYRSPSKKAPTSGTSDYTSTPDAETEYRWWEDNYCKGADPELFHPNVPSTPRPSYLAHIEHIADTYCRNCVVRAHCLEDGLKQSASYDVGIYGGFSEGQRRRMRGAYRRGTPVEVLIAKHDPGSGKKAAA